MQFTIVTGSAENVTEGSKPGFVEAGGEKKSEPPSTGSRGLLGVTVTVSGLANGWPIGVD
jgi:hypothetical protein